MIPVPVVATTDIAYRNMTALTVGAEMITRFAKKKALYKNS